MARRVAEAVASMAELRWFIEGDPMMSRHYKAIPRTRENLDEAWKAYLKMRDEVKAQREEDKRAREA